MEKSGPFNAELQGDEWDRVYLAEDLAEWISSIISNGIYPNPATGCQLVSIDNNMRVTLQSGLACILGRLYHNTDNIKFLVDPADGVLNRIDRLVLRLDYLNREIKAYLKKGTFATNPVAPVIQRDSDAYELGIADIYVGRGVIKINQSNITDLRLNKNLCGIVHGAVEQVDTTEIFNQYQAWFNEQRVLHEGDFEAWMNEFKISTGQSFTNWVNDLKNSLDPNTDVAAQLQMQITENKQELVSQKADYTRQPAYGTATGINAKVITLDPIPIAYVDGMAISFKNSTQNTGAVTLNVNSLGAKTIVKSNGNSLASGNLNTESIYTVRYNATTGNFILQGEGGEYGTVLASDVRNTKTFGTPDGVKQGALDLSKLVASNIKKGVIIDGVTGTVPVLPSEYTGQRLRIKTPVTAGGAPPSYSYQCCITIDDSTFYYKGANDGLIYKYNLITKQATLIGKPSTNQVDSMCCSDDGSILYVHEPSTGSIYYWKDSAWHNPSIKAQVGRQRPMMCNKDGSELYYIMGDFSQYTVLMKYNLLTNSSTILLVKEYLQAYDNTMTITDDGCIWVNQNGGKNYIKIRIVDGTIVLTVTITGFVGTAAFSRDQSKPYIGYVIINYTGSGGTFTFNRINADATITQLGISAGYNSIISSRIGDYIINQQSNIAQVYKDYSYQRALDMYPLAVDRNLDRFFTSLGLFSDYLYQ